MQASSRPRRLADGLGLAILANSRPCEGLVFSLPIAAADCGSRLRRAGYRLLLFSPHWRSISHGVSSESRHLRHCAILRLANAASGAVLLPHGNARLLSLGVGRVQKECYGHRLLAARRPESWIVVAVLSGTAAYPPAACLSRGRTPARNASSARHLRRHDRRLRRPDLDSSPLLFSRHWGALHSSGSMPAPSLALEPRRPNDWTSLGSRDSGPSIRYDLSARNGCRGSCSDRTRMAAGQFDRAEVASELARMPGKQLVLMSYGPHHNLDCEWVWNAADIDNSRIVWARDMGSMGNRDLLLYFKDRHFWRIDGDASPPRLEWYEASQ
jgi:hypothetical protein